MSPSERFGQAANRGRIDTLALYLENSHVESVNAGACLFSNIIMSFLPTERMSKETTAYKFYLQYLDCSLWVTPTRITGGQHLCLLKLLQFKS
jgi:hypothetical protein